MAVGSSLGDSRPLFEAAGDGEGGGEPEGEGGVGGAAAGEREAGAGAEVGGGAGGRGDSGAKRYSDTVGTGVPLLVPLGAGPTGAGTAGAEGRMAWRMFHRW